MKQVVLASSNKGKLREFSQLLAHVDMDIIPQSQFNTVEVPEDGLSFVENAIIKARNASKQAGLPAIADDSGIEVDVLKGAPGIYSARFAGPKASDQDNVNKLLADLKAVDEVKRSARFQCVIVYIRHENDPTPIICQGTWEGTILKQASGDNGFGYDPVFSVPGENCSAAELSSEIKNSLSHRGQALKQLLEKLTQNAHSAPKLN